MLGMYENVLAACRQARHLRRHPLRRARPMPTRMIRMGFRLMTIANESGLMVNAAKSAVKEARGA